MSDKDNKILKYDLFISNSDEDYQTLVVPLMAELTKQELSIWQSELMTLGDNLITTVYQALDNSTYAIVIISPDYLKDAMIREQLNTLLMQEYIGENKRVLPIWHNLKRVEIIKVFPAMATRKSVNTREGLNAVVDAILKAVRIGDSPPPPESYPVDFAILSSLSPEELMARIATLREIEKIKVEDADTYSCIGHYYMALHSERNYAIATNYFKKAIDVEPHNADHQYYCALSMLSGNPALALSVREAREIEGHLLQAHDLSPKILQSHLLSAYMVEEFFSHLSAKTQLNTLEESFGLISDLSPNRDEVARLHDHLMISKPEIRNLFQKQLQT